MRRRGGWVLMDIVCGMLLLSIVAFIISTAEQSHLRTLRRLANIRAASRLAENACMSLQTGKKIDAPTGTDEKVEVEKINDATAPSKFAWVRVTASLNGSRASLIALAPKAAEDVGGGTK